MRKWFINLIVKKIIKLAVEKADVTPYVIAAANAADAYLDKNLGDVSSEAIQTAVSEWLNKTVTAFVEELKKDNR